MGQRRKKNGNDEYRAGYGLSEDLGRARAPIPIIPVIMKIEYIFEISIVYVPLVMYVSYSISFEVMGSGSIEDDEHFQGGRKVGGFQKVDNSLYATSFSI